MAIPAIPVVVTLEVMSLDGEWVGVARYYGRDASERLGAATDHASTLAAIVGIQVRITLDWPDEEEV